MNLTLKHSVIFIFLQARIFNFCSTFSHLHCLYLLVAAVPGEEPAVFSSRHQCAISQHAQSEDAALVSSLDDVADAISACVTEMGWDGQEGSFGQTERSTVWRGFLLLLFLKVNAF